MSGTSGLFPMNADLLESGQYSELTLKTSDGKVYKLHRSVVCLQSKPLAAFVDGNFMASEKNDELTDFKEGITKTIDLKDDDPRTVDLFIKFLYTADYDVLQAPETSHDPTVVHTTEPDELLVHAKVYILAEKYDVSALKFIASKKFQLSLKLCGISDSFVTSLELMFTQTPENDRLLKDLALGFVGKNYWKLADRGDFMALCRHNGEVASEVIKAIASIPPPKPLRKDCSSRECRDYHDFYVYPTPIAQAERGFYTC
ncbi:hypothetical protein LHYA1_G004766, partial [Lachnellula hyalina]